MQYIKHYKLHLKWSQSLVAVNWDSLYNNGDVDEYFNMFHDQFSDLFNACFPVEHVKKKQRGISKHWITPGILKSIYKKHRLYKETLIQKTVDAIHKYKAYKNKLN